jgi:hypothetical protein
MRAYIRSPAIWVGSCAVYSLQVTGDDGTQLSRRNGGMGPLRGACWIVGKLRSSGEDDPNVVLADLNHLIQNEPATLNPPAASGFVPDTAAYRHHPRLDGWYAHPHRREETPHRQLWGRIPPHFLGW